MTTDSLEGEFSDSHCDRSIKGKNYFQEKMGSLDPNPKVETNFIVIV